MCPLHILQCLTQLRARKERRKEGQAQGLTDHRQLGLAGLLVGGRGMTHQPMFGAPVAGVAFLIDDGL